MAHKKKKTAQIVKDNLREYGSYVIEDRALADVRDGLKPVQRRTLWALHELKRHSGDNPGKCATVVGTVIGRYHPHGDSACYGALVNMSWLRYPLVEQHGNFGSRNTLLEANAAAYRYTETRFSEFADRLFDDISIMPLVKSFTEENEEPLFLPARVPLLLVNGCTGVAVGMATNIPPHNLGEVINAALEVLKNPDCTVDELLKHIKGPDYGGGVLLSRKDALRQLYGTGEGRLAFSCNYKFEETKNGRQRLVITGLNPNFKANKLIDETQKLAEAKLLESAANDESSMDSGTRIVVEFIDPKIINDRVMPLLRSSIAYQFYALDGKKRPKLCNLKDILKSFLGFRRKIEKLVLDEEQAKVKKRQLVDEAKLIAIRNLPKVTKALGSAKTPDDAVQKLQAAGLTEEQALIVLDVQLRTLIRGNTSSLEKTLAQHEKRLAEIKKDLKSIDRVVERRLREMLKYADDRGTKLRGGKDDLEAVPQSTYYVGITEQGKIESFTELPTKSRAAWQYLDLVMTPGKFAVVSEDNIGQSISLSFLDKFDKSVGTVLGAASENQECLVTIAENGRYVAFPPDQRRAQFMVFKETPDCPLVFAGGMGSGDTLAVIFEDGEGKLYTAEDLKITRPNVKDKPLPGLGRRRVKVLLAHIVRDNAVVVNREGYELGEGDLLDVEEAPFSVAERNLVVLEDGRRAVKTDEEVYTLLEGDMKIRTIIPLPESEG